MSSAAANELACRWEEPAPCPALAGGEVHLWLCDLDRPSPDPLGERDRPAAGPPDALSPAERERAARFHDPRSAARWARSRAQLRALLAAYTGRPAASLAFGLSPAGKPALDTGPHFSLSHSGPLALYAFSAGGELGVDIEVRRDRRAGLDRIAARAFGLQAAERLQGLAPAQREQALLGLWTLREARIKCLDGRSPTGGEPWAAELALGDGAAGALAALAALRPPPVVRFYQL